MSELEQLQAQIEALRQENCELKKTNTPELSVRVSTKGAISVYGLGRFPVTLYRSQMERLLDASDRIRVFIDQNADQLKIKG